MNVLILEDEPRAANQLQSLLNDTGLEYNLLVIIDTVEDAVSWFRSNKLPDLIFMDIQLADGLSFEIFQKVDIDAPIIFTTAFDQYAIQAFKVNSVDYLLKPIQKEDLSIAINQFRKAHKPQIVESDILKQLLSSIQEPTKRLGILVKDGSGFVQIKISELLYIYSEDSLSLGVTKSKRYVIDETLDKFYDTLESALFFKINRGQVIQKEAIQKIEPYFNHRVKLTIENPRDQEFVVSRPKTTEFKDWMNR